MQKRQQSSASDRLAKCDWQPAIPRDFGGVELLGRDPLVRGTVGVKDGGSV
ncbi:MAG: hypothetical protein OXP73_08585 [Chloroflexota bacterium]|nr:hypothetical protein [Chloroflexota bacterium]